ncbi:MAG: class I adenylate-forming enzyme family protein [Betaproteobacteria bacterium]|jgi:acyl-CoA synthetase
MLLTLHNPKIARSFYAAGWWREESMYDLLAKHANERPEAFALRDSRRRLTWQQLRLWVDSLALQLHQRGLKRGHRVSVWLPNRVEAVVIFLACSRNGYVCNPSLHQNYTVGEIVTLMQRIDTVAFFTESGYGADASTVDVFAAIEQVSSLKCCYRMDRGDFPSLPTKATAAPLPPVLNDPDKIVYLAFTSGTTGMPKGVLHSDNTLLANARAMVKDWHHDEHTILYTHSPLSHHIATVALAQGLCAGFEVVLHDLQPGQKPLDGLLESGATYVMGVPTHAIDILADAKQRGLKSLGRVNIFYMAGSTIPPQTAREFLDQGIKPQNIYGMTENGSHQYTMPDDTEQVITSTCGKACQGYETRIWDQENSDIELPCGQVGEIGTRGALLMLGYFNNQVATENSFNASGWFMSGDLGRLDELGNLQIVGRKKDLIIRGGHNIYPSRIENLVAKHPGVLKTAVYPVADERLGEKVCLAIIEREGQHVLAQALLTHLHESGLSKYDMPEFFISMQSFPLTASGKILKRELVELTRLGKINPLPVRWAATDK